MRKAAIEIATMGAGRTLAMLTVIGALFLAAPVLVLTKTYERADGAWGLTLLLPTSWLFFAVAVATTAYLASMAVVMGLGRGNVLKRDRGFLIYLCVFRLKVSALAATEVGRFGPLRVRGVKVRFLNGRSAVLSMFWAKEPLPVIRDRLRSAIGL